MKEIIIFVLGMNAGIGILFIISEPIREEIKKLLKKLDE